jgi:hypothetical protein
MMWILVLGFLTCQLHLARLMEVWNLFFAAASSTPGQSVVFHTANCLQGFANAYLVAHPFARP